MAKREQAAAAVQETAAAGLGGLVEQFMGLRMCGVPIVIVRSVDQQSTVDLLAKQGLGEDIKVVPAVAWDAVRGLVGLNKPGSDALSKARGGAVKPEETYAFSQAMEALHRVETEHLVAFAHNAHRQLYSSEPGVTAQAVQAVANLRDAFKKNFRMLVMLGPGFAVPLELTQDVVVLNHELPDAAALEGIVRRLHKGAGLAEPGKESVEKAIDALSGLSEFAAEQQVAVSLRETGLDHSALQERSRVTIEQTKGLKVYRGGQRFDEIVGCGSVKEALLADAIHGRESVGVFVFMDEIDKALANVEHDTTGVRMDQLRTLLTEMEDNEWEGMILNGLPGAGKSLLAKAAGNEAGVLTVSLDLAGMEGSLVGESEAALRNAIAVIKAVGRGRAYFVATSNNASPMRPELQRRFTGGVFFFDLMTAEQRADAWAFYMRRYGLAAQPLPADEGWTGAEIRNCCRKAWKSNNRLTLLQSAQYIVPVATSQREKVLMMRLYAHQRFLDANAPGLYDAQRVVASSMFEAEKGRMEEQMRSIQFDKTKVN
jgi:hypothetical protein